MRTKSSEGGVNCALGPETVHCSLRPESRPAMLAVPTTVSHLLIHRLGTTAGAMLPRGTRAGPKQGLKMGQGDSRFQPVVALEMALDDPFLCYIFWRFFFSPFFGCRFSCRFSLVFLRLNPHQDGTLYLWGRTSETDESLHLLRVMQDRAVVGTRM